MAAVGQPSEVATARQSSGCPFCRGLGVLALPDGSQSSGCPFCRGSGVLSLPDGSQAVCACRLGIPAAERGLDRVARGDGPVVVTKGVPRGS